MARKKNTKSRSASKSKVAAKKSESLGGKPPIKKLPLNKLGEKYKTNKKWIMVGIFAVLVLALIYYYKNLFVAAMVNNQPIGRLSVVKELEKRQGKDTLDNIITETLILQEAKKKNVVITDSEVDDEVKKVEDNLKTQGTTLEAALSFQGLTRDDLVKQIKLQKMIEKILADKIQVSDKDIEDYVKENKDGFDKSLSQDQIKDRAKQQLVNTKLGQEFQTWISDVKSNAKINYFVKY